MKKEYGIVIGIISVIIGHCQICFGELNQFFGQLVFSLGIVAIVLSTFLLEGDKHV